MQIKEIKTDAEFEGIYPVLKELRSTPSLKEVLELCREAERRDEFKLVAAFDRDECVGVMGYRILYDLTHGKHLYVDDLVVTQHRRSQGVGRTLLNYADQRAKDLNCRALRLCTGIDNHKAQVFYEREGWNKRSYAFKKFFSDAQIHT